jgi:predicted tellurium resistance membrane protein TerC
VRRFRYLDETIAVVLGAVAIKLAIEEWVKIGPIASLAGVAVLFTIGIVASIIADKRDPEGAQEHREQKEREQGRAESDADADSDAGAEKEPSGSPS